MKFNIVIAAGTFDPLHKGHKALLKKAIEIGEHVEIGLTSDIFVSNKRKKTKPHQARKQALEEFFKQEGASERIKILPIDDPYGPAITDPNYEAIVVSPESRYRAEEINQLRKNANLKPLAIVEIPFVLGEDGEPISSTKIIEGKIDVEGRICKK